MQSSPPRVAERLLTRVLPPGERSDAIVGDLAEEYVTYRRGHSPLVANLWYWSQSVRIGTRVLLSRRRPRPISRKDGSLMSSILRDLRHSLRGMMARPAFTAIIVVTLALGIGANAAIFSVIDALVLRPFPIPKIDRLVKLFGIAPNSDWPRGGIAPADFLDFDERSEILEELIAFEWWDVNVTSGDQPERLQGTLVTPGFFELLGVEIQLGRNLAPDRDNDAKTAVLSHAFWSRRFAANPEIVGQTILLNGERYDVVGVAAERFTYPNGTDVWSPLRLRGEDATDRDRAYLEVFGRLRDGATLAEARAELDLIAERLEQEYPGSNQGRGVNTMSMAEAVVDLGAPTFLYMWQATSVFVLLIACVNVANLLLARGTDRQKELSLQLALGAGRWGVVSKLLTENIVLALSGAALALPLAWIGVELLRSNLPAHIQRFVMGWDQIDLDWHVLGFTAAVTLVTALVFGLVPAIQASRPDLTAALREGGRGHSDDRTRLTGRNVLVVAEVALALALLVASGLSIRGTLRMANSDQGYDPEALMTMELVLPDTKYEDLEKRRQFYRSVLSGVRALPGVIAADMVNNLPSGGSNLSRAIEIEGRPVENVSERPLAHFRTISAGYLDTMRIPLIRGRALTHEDRADSLRVAVVSDLFARGFFPGEDAIGRRFRFGDETEWVEVVGVSGDVLHDWFLREPQPTFYVPLPQSPRLGMAIAIRTTGAPEEITAAVRSEVARADPDQPIYNAQTMRTKISERIIGLKYAATIMGIFGAIALVLAAVGIYGVMAYSVSRRTHEIGLRAALGADRNDILGLTLGRALRVTAIGIGIGLVLAYLAGRLMVSALFAVVQLDAATFVGLTLVLASVSLLASYLPARRALAIDPATALRVD